MLVHKVIYIKFIWKQVGIGETCYVGVATSEASQLWAIYFKLTLI